MVYQWWEKGNVVLWKDGGLISFNLIVKEIKMINYPKLL